LSTLLKIKEVAFTLFAQKGYEATTLNDIAAEVGIKKPSLYVYFSSKQELFLTLFEDLLTEYERELQIISDHALKSNENSLFYLFEKYILWFAQEPIKTLFWNRVFLFPPQELKEELLKRISSVEDQFIQKEIELIDRLIEDKEIRSINREDVLLSFRSLREGMLMTFLINSNLDKEKLKSIWDIYWNGVKERG